VNSIVDSDEFVRGRLPTDFSVKVIECRPE